MLLKNGEHLAQGGAKNESISNILHSAAMAEGSTTRQLLPRLLEAVRLHLGMEVGFISRFASGRREFMYVSSDGSRPGPEQGNSDPLEESTCFRVANKMAPNLVADAQTHPSLSDLSVVGRLGIRSHISVVIPSAAGRTFGTLCCYSFGEKQELDDRDLGFMEVIADLIGTSLEEEQRVFDEIVLRRQSLRDVLETGKLEMVWQPIVDIFTGKTMAVESLARFRTEPYRPPNEWFDEAVNLGIGTELEKSAFAKGMAIKDALPPNVYVGCNLSGTTFLQPEFQEFLRGQNLEQIVLEITEHDAIADYTELSTRLAEFRQQGLRLAIDDFGAGYAGFRHIVELDPDIIKLDISLVRNIDRRRTNQRVVKALAGFAEDQGASLLAEGVETEAELEMLRSLGIGRVQGYLFHKPMVRDQLLDLFPAS